MNVQCFRNNGYRSIWVDGLETCLLIEDGEWNKMRGTMVGKIWALWNFVREEGFRGVFWVDCSVVEGGGVRFMAYVRRLEHGGKNG